MTDVKLRNAILHIKKRLEGGEVTDTDELVSGTIRDFGLDAKDGLALEKVVERSASSITTTGRA